MNPLEYVCGSDVIVFRSVTEKGIVTSFFRDIRGERKR